MKIIAAALCAALIASAVSAETTKATPSDLPTKATPSDLPTKATPSDTPTKVTPTAVPTKFTPTDVPSKHSTIEPTSASTTARPTPPHCLPGAREAVEHSCRNYIECDHTYRWIEKRCTTFCKVFDVKQSKCVWNWQSPCLKPPTTVLPPQTPTTVLPTAVVPTSNAPECLTEGVKKPFKKGDCKNYLECDSKKWVKKSCKFGYDFDVKSNSCAFSWWAKC